MNIELMMKAVNDLKGDLASSCVYKGNKLYLFLNNSSGRYVSHNDKATHGLYTMICTVKEFNQLITELSNWQPTLPKVEVVEVDGMVYEIGKIYEFSDGDEYPWITSRLVKADADHAYKFESQEGAWNYIRACKSNIGTITPAPVKLIDGAVYSFITNGSDHVGYYSFADNYLYWGSHSFKLSGCTNITRLVPEGK